jgi:hypothetical protein
MSDWSNIIAKCKVMRLEIYTPVLELQDFMQNYLLVFSIHIGYKLKYHLQLSSLESVSKKFIES